MTVRKTDNLLRGDRTPAYVDRETGAAELVISTDTWDQWVKEGRLPRPCDTFPSGTPRWRWEDVDRKLSGRTASDTTDAAMRGALRFGQKKGNRRGVARRGRDQNHPQKKRKGLHLLLLESRTKHRPRGRADQIARCDQATGTVFRRSRAAPEFDSYQLSGRLNRRSHHPIPRKRRIQTALRRHTI